MNDTCQLAGCSEVDDKLGVVVCLHERSRNSVGDAAFNNLLHHIRLLFAPCREEHLVGREQRVNTHRDRARRHLVECAEAVAHLLAGGLVDEDDTTLRSET